MQGELLLGLVLVSRCSTLGAAVGAASLRHRTREGARAGNPLLEKYRRWTLDYERDAREADAAAQKYASMTKAMSQGSAVELAVSKEMDRLKARPWANAVWHFEKMLRDPRPARASEASKAAAAPYEESAKAYGEREQQYGALAQRLAQRVTADAELAKSLAKFSNQYRFEGNDKKAAELRKQAVLLMRRAVEEKAKAEENQEMAETLYEAVKKIQNMARMASAHAAYEENPAGALPSSHLFTFTVAPPPAGAQGD